MGIDVTEHQEVVLDILLEKVYRDSGYDFRDYRRGTVKRRLERRMLATGVNTYIDYMRFLDSHPEEYDRFTNYLTIKVSSFFRNPYAYRQMAALVLPEMIKRKKRRRDYCLRLWSAGCARGEEAYSMAIMLADFLKEDRVHYDITVSASDIGHLDLGELRSGVYPASDVERLPRSILDSYFLPDGDSYKVRADIRQMVSFFHFDLTSVDGLPLPEMDCIFCCNVLIYFQRQLQGKVLDQLYNSLAVPGYLVLGEVETPTAALLEKLECLDSKAKIYKKVRT